MPRVFVLVAALLVALVAASEMKRTVFRFDSSEWLKNPKNAGLTLPPPPAEIAVSLIFDETPHLQGKRNASFSTITYGYHFDGMPPAVITAASDYNAWGYRPEGGVISAAEQYHVDLKKPNFASIYAVVFMNSTDTGDYAYGCEFEYSSEFNLTLSGLRTQNFMGYTATFNRCACGF